MLQETTRQNSLFKRSLFAKGGQFDACALHIGTKKTGTILQSAKPSAFMGWQCGPRRDNSSGSVMMRLKHLGGSK
ncbi:MAG: hypothetical protein AAF950_02730 [Pseudomonadota bacterium]